MAEVEVLKPFWRVEAVLEPPAWVRGEKARFAIINSLARPDEFRLARTGVGASRWRLGPKMSKTTPYTLMADLAHGYRTGKSCKQTIMALDMLHHEQMRKRLKEHRAGLRERIEAKALAKSNPNINIF